MDPIFDLDAIKAEMQNAESEDTSDGQRKSVYLGSVLSLTPSGKYYTPWTNSNVRICQACLDACHVPCDEEGPCTGEEPHCEACLDAQWQEQAEDELNSIGLSIEPGEGDPTDLFAVQYLEQEPQRWLISRALTANPLKKTMRSPTPSGGEVMGFEAKRQTKAEIMAPVNDYRDARVIANNTVHYWRSDGTYCVRYHDTTILVQSPDGTVTLDSGGWQTYTTRDRFNKLFGGSIGNLKTSNVLHLWQHNNIWHIRVGDFQNGITYAFRDNMTIADDGTVTGAQDVEHLKDLNKRIAKYVRGFVKTLTARKLPAPGAGDCWFCCMKITDPPQHAGKTWGDVTGDASHLEEHMKEGYYVPTLLVNAMEQFGSSQAARHCVGYWFKMHDERCGPWENYAPRELRTALRRYLRLRLGLGA